MAVPQVGLLTDETTTPMARILPAGVGPKIDAEVATCIPEHLAIRYNCIPLEHDGVTLKLAMTDPHDPIALEDVRLITGFEVQPVGMEAHRIWSAHRRLGWGVPPLPPAWGSPLTPTELSVEAHISAPLVSVEVIQSFTNASEQPVEGVYVYKLVAGAVIYGFSVEMPENRYEGVVETARTLYQGESHLTAQLGTLQPGQTVVIRLRYMEQLMHETFRFSLEKTRNTRVKIGVRLDTAGFACRLACTQPVRCLPLGDGLRIELDCEQGLRPGDFQLLARSEHGTRLWVGPDHFLAYREVAEGLFTNLRLVDRGLNYLESGLNGLIDLHPGQPLQLSGLKLGSGGLDLSWDATPEGTSVTRLTSTPTDNPALGIFWARERLRQLACARQPDTAAMQGLSLQYGLLTRWTRYTLGGSLGEVVLQSPEAVVETLEACPRSLVHLTDRILWGALERGASHIHVEPGEQTLAVRYRIDDQLRAGHEPGKQVQGPLMERLKTGFQMNPTLTGCGQTGRRVLQYHGKDYLALASTTPTRFGDKLVVSLHPQKETVPLPPTLEELLEAGRGLVIVAGPGLHRVLRGCVESLNRKGSLLVLGAELEGPPGPLYVKEMPPVETDHDAVVSLSLVTRQLESRLVVAGLRSPDCRSVLLRLLPHPECCARLSALVATQRLRKLCGCVTGCSACDQTGFKGSLELTVVVTVSPSLRMALLGGRPDQVWQQVGPGLDAAFRAQAEQAVGRGDTSPLEVDRVLGTPVRELPVLRRVTSPSL